MPIGRTGVGPLQSWDEQELAAICAGADTPASVAEFFFHSGKDRKPVISALLVNPAIPELVVMQFAERASSELIPGIIFAAIERRSRPILVALGGNRDSLRYRGEIEEAVQRDCKKVERGN